jgi:hypothetical protein
MADLRATIADILLNDQRIQSAIEEFTQMIADHYPGTTFSTFVGEDPLGVYLRATVDIDDTDEVMDLIIDRLMTIQNDEELPFYVIPTQTRERNEAIYRREHPQTVSSDRSIIDVAS